MSVEMCIAHDYLTQRGGAERVVLAFCNAFPDADIVTSLYDPDGTFPEFRERSIKTLWLDRLTLLRHRHRLALPLLPIAWASSTADAKVVLCSSSGWAHGIRTRGRKIVYCYSPAKWLYRPEDYLGARPAAGARIALRLLATPLRRFDRKAAISADLYLTSSTFIAQQIEDVYGIKAAVVPPPIGIDAAGEISPVAGLEPGYVLTVARLLPYKNVGPTIDAFRILGEMSLVVVGDGPLGRELAASCPSNVTFLSGVSDAQLRWIYANCSCLVAASREDYGLTPIEAAAFGKPVAALRWGGFLDTVVPGVTGLFFDAADPVTIASSIRELAAGKWDEGAIRRHAASFSEERFVDKIRHIVTGLSRETPT